LTEEDAPPTKKKKRKNPFLKSNRMLPTSLCPELTLKTLLPMKDPSKPDGEAVNTDGSLKPADQITWLNSPSDESRPPILDPYEDTEDAAPGNMQEQKKSHVSYYESRGHDNEDSPSQLLFGSDHENDDDFRMDMYADVETRNAATGSEANVEDNLNVDDNILVDDDSGDDRMSNKDDEQEIVETENEEEAGASEEPEEDVDEDAEKRYWEAKTKEGVHKV
jgi:hypothetical protein